MNICAEKPAHRKSAKRYRKRKIYLITGRVDIEFGFCSITVSSMEKLATVGRDDLSKS
jgi:hypothetical protein